MSVWRVASALSHCLVWLWISVIAKAQPSPERPALNWVRLPGAESCIGAAELSDKIAARTGSRLFESVHDAQLFIEGFVEPSAEGFRATLLVSDRAGLVLGTRYIQSSGSECRTLDDALVLVTAVTLHPKTELLGGEQTLAHSTLANLDALFAPETAELDPGKLPTTPITSDAARQAASRDRDNRDDRGRAERAGVELAREATERALWLDLGLQAGVGPLPDVHVGLAMRAQLRTPSFWPVELGLRATLPRSTSVPNAPDDTMASVRFALMSGSIALCPAEPQLLRGLSVCLGVDIGRESARARGFLISRNVHKLLLDATALLSWRPQLTPRTHLRVSIALLTPLIERTYTYESPNGDSSQLRRASRFGGWVEAAWGANF